MILSAFLSPTVSLCTPPPWIRGEFILMANIPVFPYCHNLPELWPNPSNPNSPYHPSQEYLSYFPPQRMFYPWVKEGANHDKWTAL